MSTAAVVHPPVLADRLLSRSLTTDIALVLTGAAVVGVLAQAEVPMIPVPMTGQTLGVLLVGGSLGMRRGAMALFTYLVLGLAGVPWFAGMTGGPAALLKPSFGYIIGFVFAAALVGWLAERTWDRRPALAMAGFLLASAVPFLFGMPYLAWIAGQPDLAWVLANGFTPFIVGGVVKAGIAAVVFPLAWSMVRRADEHKG